MKNPFKQFGSQYIVLLKQLGLVMGVYMLLRVLFWGFNASWFEGLGGGILLTAIGKGILFDLSAVIYSNLLIIVLSLLPFGFVQHRVYQLVLKIIFLLVNGVAILMNAIDLRYVSFTGRRMDQSSLNILGDIQDQAFQLVGNYWGVSLLFLGLMVLLWKLLPSHKQPKYPLSWWKGMLIFVVFGGLVVLGLRGGIGGRPLMPIHAYQTGAPNEVALLTQNTPFQWIRSLGKKELEEFTYMDASELDAYLGPAYLSDRRQDSSHTNVVLIILESFSAEFIGHIGQKEGYTPFLDSLAGQGASFQHAIANGRTSAKAISTILSGMPSLFNTFLSNSLYQSNRFYNLFETLREQGYQTGFYHGGFNGTMFFDSWTSKLGIPYFGYNEYPNKDDFDGTWGIFDGPYLQYFAQELDQYQQPFAASVFTLSSHQPFDLPAEYEGKFPEGKFPVIPTVGYVDHALARFFATASQMNWFPNTLFVITADHSYPVVRAHEEFFELYKIPLVFYHPSQELQIDSLQIVEQLDIPISIADHLGIEAGPFPRFSRSVFQKVPEQAQDAIYYLRPFWYLFKRDYIIRFDGEEDLSVVDWQQELIPNSSIAPTDLSYLKAYIQYYNSNMLHNTFVEQAEERD